MTQMTTECRSWFRSGRRVLTILAASLLLAAAAAAQSGDATTYEDCFRSLRTCQKKRCGNAAGQEQVTCVRQCAREYDTCVNGAGAGGDAQGKRRKATPGGEKGSRRQVERYKTPAASK